MRLLGCFRLLKNGHVVGAQRRKTEALLARSASRQNGVPRDVLLRALWPRSDRAPGLQALNSLVHELRSASGRTGRAALIVLTGGHYRLNKRLASRSTWPTPNSLMGSGEHAERVGETTTGSSCTSTRCTCTVAI